MMRRRVLPMLGLVLAGCATGVTTQPEPQGVRARPLPSLHETINAGPAPGDGYVSPASAPVDGARPAPWADQTGAPRPQLVAPPQALTLPPLPPDPTAPPATMEPLPSLPEPGPSEVAPDTLHDPHLQPAMYQVPTGADAGTAAAAAPATTPAPASVDPLPGSAVRSNPEPAPRPGRYIGLTIATAGEDSIGLRELEDAVREWQRTNLSPGQRLQPDQINDLATSLLEQLIDRALLTQEAQRTLLKNDKQRQMFEEFVDKQWKEQEIPRLMRKNNVKDEITLRSRLADQKRSLDLMRQTYHREVLAREFLHQQLKDRVARPELPQLWAYYRSHLDAFSRPARVTWREILVRFGPEGPQAARQRAEQILQHLRTGADFATVATSHSQGPTAPKGGLWETQPGASATPAVNAALESLPLNAISPLIEGPRGWHIVRVEGRQAAGPAPFESVQSEIARKIQEEQFTKAVEGYTQSLRARSLVTYQFGRPPEPRDDDTQRTGGARP